MTLPTVRRRPLAPRASFPLRVRLRVEELEARLAPTANLTVVHTSDPSNATVSVSNPTNATQTYSATVVSAAQAVDQSLGLVYTGNYSQSAYGINGKWLQSTNGSNSANGGWYFLLSDGTLHQWDGGTTGTTASSSPVVATFAPAVYNNPLTLAAAAGFNTAVAQEQSLDLYYTGSYSNSSYGINADWLKSGNNSNSANGGWYFLLPNGTLHQWDGVGASSTAASSPLVATLNATFWQDPMQLLGAPLAGTAVAQEQALDLQFTGSYSNSSYGINADWLKSGLPSSLANSNSAHGGWYFLLPNGELHQWDGVGSSSTASSSPLVANFGVSAGTPTNTVPSNVTSPYWQEPPLLYNPLVPQSPPAGVQATFATPSNNGTSNVLQLSGYRNLTGSFGVQVTVAGGATPTIQDFMVTATDQAPALVSVPSQTATYTGTLSVTLTGSDADPNETLTYGGQLFTDSVSALAVSSGAYAQVQALGLTTFQTFTGFSGYWMKSPNGNWYILLSDGTLHQWDGSGAATGPLIATFNSTLYTNIAYLLNPVAANAVTVTASNNVLSFGGMNNYYIGKTLYAVASVSDGDLQGYTTFPITLLTAAGDAWPAPKLITISFVPDGTIVGADVNGNITSNLFSTFNSHSGWTTATWQDIIIQAAQTWAQQTNINFQIVPDSGQPTASGNYQQGDPQWGDIRIGAYNFGSSMNYLAAATMPPPVNNFDIAGDINFNTAYGFNNNGSLYDLFSVAAHELGHTLGLEHSTVSTAVMFGAYNGVKSSLNSDDITVVRSIYGGARVQDAYGAGSTPNHSFSAAANLTSQIDPTALTALQTGLDVTNAGEADYYTFTAPAGTSGALTVNVQTTGLSLLRQAVTVYASNQTTVLGSASSANAYDGTTDTVTVSGVTAGQVFYVKVAGADTTAFGTGAYAMTLNFGTGASPTVPLPNTRVLNGSPLQAGGGEPDSPPPLPSSILANANFTLTNQYGYDRMEAPAPPDARSHGETALPASGNVRTATSANPAAVPGKFDVKAFPGARDAGTAAPASAAGTLGPFDGAVADAVARFLAAIAVPDGPGKQSGPSFSLQPADFTRASTGLQTGNGHSLESPPSGATSEEEVSDALFADPDQMTALAGPMRDDPSS